jgi:hypothetical protein
MSFLEIRVDKLVDITVEQHGKSGWREPTKKKTEMSSETYKIYIENVYDIQGQGQGQGQNFIDIYSHGSLKDEYKQFQNLIDKKIFEIYEIRCKTSMYMNTGISSELPKLMEVKLFL